MKDFYIQSLHEVFVDDYNEGEKEYSYSYDQKGRIKAETYEDAVNIYFDTVLLFNLGIENCELNKESNTLETSCLVDSEQNQPNEYQVKCWENGYLELYVNRISISVFEVTEVILK